MKWISVKERLPERDGYYLAYVPCLEEESRIDIDHFNKECRGRQWLYWQTEITHWQPLPAPPSEE